MGACGRDTTVPVCPTLLMHQLEENAILTISMLIANMIKAVLYFATSLLNNWNQYILLFRVGLFFQNSQNILASQTLQPVFFVAMKNIIFCCSPLARAATIFFKVFRNL